MQFSSSLMDTHMLKRARNGDEDDKNGDFEIVSGVKKRHCSSSGISELWGLDEQDFEEEEDEEDMVFACNESEVFGVLREETADSETSSSKVYYNSEDFSPPFCRSSSSAYFLRFPVPDDAQSSTSDSCCCCCCDSSDDDEEEHDDDDGDEGNEGESSSASSFSSSSLPASDSTQNFISYLYEASDDDLGLPPALCTSYDDCKNDVYQSQSKVLEKHVQGLDLDLDVDLDLDFDLDLGLDDDQLLGLDL